MNLQQSCTRNRSVGMSRHRWLGGGRWQKSQSTVVSWAPSCHSWTCRSAGCGASHFNTATFVLAAGALTHLSSHLGHNGTLYQLPLCGHWVYGEEGASARAAAEGLSGPMSPSVSIFGQPRCPLQSHVVIPVPRPLLLNLSLLHVLHIAGVTPLWESVAVCPWTSWRPPIQTLCIP